MFWEVIKNAGQKHFLWQALKDTSFLKNKMQMFWQMLVIILSTPKINHFNAASLWLFSFERNVTVIIFVKIVLRYLRRINGFALP